VSVLKSKAHGGAVQPERIVTNSHYRNWFKTSASSSMTMALNQLVEAYGNMEVIRLAPTPVAHLLVTHLPIDQSMLTLSESTPSKS